MSNRPAYNTDALGRIRAREAARREYEARLVACTKCGARYDPALFVKCCPWCAVQNDGHAVPPDAA